MIRYLSKLVCLIPFLPALLVGQERQQPEEVNDMQLWTGAKFKLEFTKDFRLEIEQQYRFEDTLQILDKTFTEMGVRYEFNDYFDIKGQYRYNVNERARNEHRWTIDLSFDYDIDDFPVDVGYRFRFTDEKVSYTGEKTNYLRNRLSLDWNMSKLVDPYVEYENFYRLNQKNEWRVNRFTFGLEWKINDEADIETYYRVEDEFNVEVPENQHIFGLMFSYEIEMH